MPIDIDRIQHDINNEFLHEVDKNSTNDSNGDKSNIPSDQQQHPEDILVGNNSIPSSLRYIMGNEVCERFSFYGLRTILSIYCTNFMGYTANTATIIVSTFNFLAFAFPLLGAYLADARIGKFNTLFAFSIVYCIGGIIMAVTSIEGVTGPGPGDRSPWGLILGLILISVGTGGIKPVVSAFCGDQLNSDQKHLLQKVFQMFYWSINLGSFFSCILTPLLRRYVGYWLAFGVPSCLLVLSTVVLLMGRRKYVYRPVAGSILLDMFSVLGCAVREKIKSRKDGYDDRYYHDHWLDRAKIKFDQKLVDSVRAALKVLVVFLPMPFFWALYDQTASRWVQTAQTMDLHITGGFSLEPDQIQLLPAASILLSHLRRDPDINHWSGICVCSGASHDEIDDHVNVAADQLTWQRYHYCCD
ncbi:hypothetical protein SAMD00019534_018910 [Acytostelium subglobosum LB1]|uniref:hypothetical protein n=1 Tax=Acytostelium subglobosum LB1 TaxID=1410327 RepID=UPI000644E473|nr:hypothetical protein SAMD00019534_018910 [Acytostelium subglobosum LB1]GAM18716.1 hypothetical protein SAMD00019534_018910 [Acytostelium subglobosum LB1]|eukprot:XP_012757936.1 hypothetical protein SAMD00019534_018910 [Acytostelium subglobosum LB1]